MVSEVYDVDQDRSFRSLAIVNSRTFKKHFEL